MRNKPIHYTQIPKPLITLDVEGQNITKMYLHFSSFNFYKNRQPFYKWAMSMRISDVLFIVVVPNVLAVYLWHFIVTLTMLSAFENTLVFCDLRSYFSRSILFVLEKEGFRENRNPLRVIRGFQSFQLTLSRIFPRDISCFAVAKELTNILNAYTVEMLLIMRFQIEYDSET